MLGARATAAAAARSSWLTAAPRKRPTEVAGFDSCAGSGRRRRQRSVATTAVPPCASLAYEVDGTRVLPEDARDALAQGDVYKALFLLEEPWVGGGEEPAGGAACIEASAATPTTTTAPERQQQAEEVPLASSPLQQPAEEAEEAAAAAAAETSPRAAHARLIRLLWKAGHEKEARETFDLARERAREAEKAAAAAARSAADSQKIQQRSPSRNGEKQTPTAPPQERRRSNPVSGGGDGIGPKKHGAGVPGLYLDLDPDTCHGIMRSKLEEQDFLGVVDAMRAASRVPPRQGAGGRGAAALITGKAEVDLKAGLGDGDGSGGWAPTEETYGLALEACGKVGAGLGEGERVVGGRGGCSRFGSLSRHELTEFFSISGDLRRPSRGACSYFGFTLPALAFDFRHGENS